MVGKTDFNTKVTEVEVKISSITGLATNLELTAVENKILDANDLITKTDYDTKISDIEKRITDHDHDEYITSPEFNTLAASTFNARLAAQTDLIRKPEFDAKLKDISDRIPKNKTKHLLVENELKKLKTVGLSYFWSRTYFEDNDGAQNSLVFQVKVKYFEDNSGSDSSSIEIWKSNGLSNQSLGFSASVVGADDIKMSKPIRPAYIIFNHKRSFFVQKKENVMKSRSIVSIYIVYKLSSKIISSSNVLKNNLFGAIKKTKPNNTTNPQKYVYSGHGISFDRTGQFTDSDGIQARNIIIFGVDLSASKHNTNKKQSILVLGHGLIQKINNTTIYAE